MEDGSRRLQDLLRDGLARPLQALSGEPPIWVVVAEQLTREIEAASKRDARGRVFSPDQFTLSLHTIDARTLAGNTPNVQDAIARAIHDALQAAGFSLARFPHVTLSADPTLRIGEARAIAWHSRDPLGSVAKAGDELEEPLTPPAVGAFLIVDGKRHFRLDRSLITIGRKLDNHLVLPDPHVSRRHAEIRLQGGRYMMRDLNSTAGTRVNGQLAMEHLLQPGDVITISGISLIYGEDPTGPPGATQRYTPPSMGRKDPNQVTPLNLRRPDSFATRPTASGEDLPGPADDSSE
jgi:pSer/pThr/pTyr-binding forkhead associated (FHA) protein